MNRKLVAETVTFGPSKIPQKFTKTPNVSHIWIVFQAGKLLLREVLQAKAPLGINNTAILS